jgi:hypothetical protein
VKDRREAITEADFDAFDASHSSLMTHAGKRSSRASAVCNLQYDQEQVHYLGAAGPLRAVVLGEFWELIDGILEL